jgi:hypothetical protein
MPKQKTAKQKAQQAAKKGKGKAKGKGATQCPLAGLAPNYAKLVKGSKPWRWSSVKKGLSRTDRKKIRDLARQQKLIPQVKLTAKRYPIFPKKYVKDDNTNLPKNMWKTTDSKQFTWLNNDLESRNPDYDAKTQTFRSDPNKKKYTWHHHQDPGRMQLVEFGIHNNTSHDGGRTTWAKGKR